MVKSVEHILKTEFDRSLSDAGVNIIDPFVGTGNFIVRTMREIRRTALQDKYTTELHCNEVMLLPYYIASMNIEHEFYEATDTYRPFEGLCLVDIFELAEDHQLALFTAENTARVERQKETDMFVIIGNPPYNMGQVDENDNNQNRKYETMDRRVSETYARDSQATLKNKLSDPYVKSIRWVSDRIGEEGVIAFVTNNRFLDGVAFDGMRKHLADDFDGIYILDLSGNVRKNPKLSGTTHNVFGIQVGVSINFFVKKRDKADPQTEIFYTSIDEFWRKEDKYRYLDSKEHYRNIEWMSIPFYIYDEDGINRRENITDWALEQFRTHYRDDTITKCDIFHYVYALLHHPDYREHYQANLKRELPRLPYVPAFWELAKAGARLAKIHVGYEDQHEYSLNLNIRSTSSKTQSCRSIGAWRR